METGIGTVALIVTGFASGYGVAAILDGVCRRIQRRGRPALSDTRRIRPPTILPDKHNINIVIIGQVPRCT